MKFLLYGLVGLLSFLGSIAAMLAISGKLNAETIQQLIKGEKSAAAAVTPQTDPLGPLAAQLKAREAALDAREQSLSAREQQINEREKALIALRKEVEQLQQNLLTSVEERETQREASIVTQAQTITEMKADAAAEALEGMPVEEAAEILAQVKEKERGGIVEAMNIEFRIRVLAALGDL